MKRFHRITEQCAKCNCYYLNWEQEVIDHMKECGADYVECTHEFDTMNNTPCICFSPKED